MADAVLPLTSPSKLLPIEYRHFSDLLLEALNLLTIVVENDFKTSPRHILEEEFNAVYSEGVTQKPLKEYNLMQDVQAAWQAINRDESTPANATREMQVVYAIAALLEKDSSELDYTDSLNTSFQWLENIITSSEFEKSEWSSPALKSLYTSTKYVQKNVEHWIAYPQFAARWNIIVDEVRKYLASKIQSASNIIVDDGGRAPQAPSAPPRGSAGLPFLGGSPSKNSSSSQSGALNLADDKLQGIKIAGKELATKIRKVRNDLENDLIDWKRFGGQDFDDLLLSPEYGFLRQDISKNLSWASDYEELKRKFDAQAHPAEAKKAEVLPKRIEFAVANKLIEDETRRLGALTKGQIDKLLFSAGYERADESVISDLYNASAAIAAVQGTTPDRSQVVSQKELQESGLPSEVVTLLKDQTISPTDLAIIITSTSRAQTPIELAQLLSQTTLSAALREQLTASLRATVSTGSRSSNTDLESYLEDSPALRDSIEIYAATAAYFETVPEELLERLRRELPTSDPKLRRKLESYFYYLRSQEQDQILALTGGTLPQYLDLNDFDNPSLQAQIAGTKGRALEQLAALRKRLGTSAAFHRIVSVPRSQNQAALTQVQAKIQSIADKDSQAFKDAMLELGTLQSVTTAQKQYLQKLAVENAKLSVRERIMLVALGKQPTVSIDENATVGDSFRLTPTQAPGGSSWQPTPESFADYSDENAGDRSSFFRALAPSSRGNDGQDVKSRLAQTNASVSRLSSLLKNPAFLGGVGAAGVGAMTIYSTITSGIGGGAVTLGMGAAGAAIGGPLGALVGSGLSLVHLNFDTSLPFLGHQSLASAGGDVFRSIAGNSGSIVQSAGQLGSAASQAAPGTGANIATALGGPNGLGANLAQGASTVANASITGANNFFGALSGASIGTAPSLIIPGVLGGTAIVAVIATTAMTGAFLVPGDIASCQESNGIRLCKTNDIIQALDPVDVTYTIRIEANEGSSVTIKDVKDNFEVRRSTEGTLPTPPTAPADVLNSLIGKTVTSDTPLQITYKIPFGADFKDTQVINTFRVGFATGSSSSDASATSSVTFGEVVYGGCWPTTGTITQGPFALRTHCLIDAIDIFPNDESGGPNGPIFTPLEGTAQFFCQVDGGCTSHYAPIYGNAVILTTTDGKKIVFGHMSKFAEPFKGGDSILVKKGTQLGNMGNTGTGQQSASTGQIISFGEHLHYEYTNNNIGTCKAPFPASKLFEDGVIPEPLDMNESDQNFRVPKTQRVRYDACGTTAGAPDEGKEVAKVSCFSFKNGNKNWIVDGNRSQLDQYLSEMRRLLSLPYINDALCGDGKTISIVRHETDPNSTTDGCNFDGTGEAGAEWSGGLLDLQVCDKLFSDPDTFGVNTMWHEPGHAFQRKHLGWTIFPNFTLSYLPTYPLNKSKSEDFAEAFGLCNYNLSLHPNFMTDPNIVARYRNQNVVYDDYKNQCSALEPILGTAAASANNTPGF